MHKAVQEGVGVENPTLEQIKCSKRGLFLIGPRKKKKRKKKKKKEEKKERKKKEKKKQTNPALQTTNTGC